MSNLFEFELFDIKEAPVRSTLQVGFLTAVSIGINFVFATVLEAVFPVYSDKRNVWLGALEAVAELILLIVGATLIAAFGGNFFRMALLYSTMVGIYMLGGAWQKLQALRMHLLS